MKKQLLLFILLLMGLQALFAQVSSTQGKEFWVGFMDNYNTMPTLKLIISGKRNCTGTIKNGFDNTVISTFTVTPGQLTNISIPSAYSSQVSEVIEQLGIYVSSTDTISLYASNYVSATFDVANVLPTTALADTYRVQTYPTDILGSEFMIVATEDNTIVDITPTTATVKGKPANATYSVTLNKGQTYQVISYNASGDFSGTFIKARDCKKIAVFNGNVCARVPSGCAACDHMVEQALPIYYWGRNFAITNSVGRSSDRVRVTASEDGTKIYKNGTLVATINTGATYEFAISSTEKSCYLETTAPCAVNLYFIGVSCGGSSLGDPSSVWISPIEQKINEITFGTFQTTLTNSHYANVVTSSDGVAAMTLDNVNVASQFAPLAGNNQFSFARIPITYGAHTLKNTTGFTAYVYGFGNSESYGYSVGSSAVNLNKQILINGIQSGRLPTEQTYCVNSDLSLKPSVSFPYSNVAWDFGDGNKAVGDSVGHIYPAIGEYMLKMVVKRTVSTCSGVLTDTVSFKVRVINKNYNFTDYICSGLKYKKYGFNVTVKNDTTIYRTASGTLGCDSTITVKLITTRPNSSLTKAVICEGDSCIFNKMKFTRTGLYHVTLTNKEGCDTIASLNLTVNPVYNRKDSRVICSDELPYAYADTIFKPGTLTNTYIFHRKTILGCDSIVNLLLTVHPVKTTLINDTIVQHQPYSAYGFAVPLQPKYGTFTFYQYKKTIFGCDSTIILKLKVSPQFHAEMKESPQICGDDKDFTLTYDLQYGNIEQHSVVFDDKARQAGFSDIIKQQANGQSITVSVPPMVTPNTYLASIVFDNGPVAKKIPVSFTIFYPSSVILQKWNDVLALYSSNYNGGYEFSGYQWYKNGQQILGATKSYLYLADDKLDMNAQYFVQLTRKNDGVSLFTCPVIPNQHTDVTVYPTLVQKNCPVIVKTESKGTATLLNIAGLKMKEQPLICGENYIVSPDVLGTYVLVITDDKGSSRKQLLIVK